MTKKTNQVKKPLTKNEELSLFLNFMITGRVENEQHAQLINRVSKRSASMNEAAMTAKATMIAIDNKLTQMMEVIQVQNIVLQKLGATDEMFEQAETEYNEMLEKTRKELEAQAEEAEAEAKAATEEAAE